MVKASIPNHGGRTHEPSVSVRSVPCVKYGGGGRVRVLASETCVLNGTVSAAGVGAIGDDEEHSSAGAGGTVWISCRTVRQPDTAGGGSEKAVVIDELGLEEGEIRFSRIVASGGCCERCACGGGGRVLTEVVDGLPPRRVLVSGGCHKSTEAGACQCGSAGTWAFLRLPSARHRPARRTGFLLRSRGVIVFTQEQVTAIQRRHSIRHNQLNTHTHTLKLTGTR